MKQLEKRFYSREEIGEITGVDAKSQNFKRNVSNKLTNWGYTAIYGKKSFTIERIPETAKERLSEIMIREYGLDIQCDCYDFAIFMFCLLEDSDGFSSMPWQQREVFLKDVWNVNVSFETLRKWCAKLIKSNTVAKNKDNKTYWITTSVNGVKYQEELDDGRNNPLWQKYWHKFFELQKTGQGGSAYSELGYCVYSCPSFVFSAFDDTGLLEEVIELVKEIADEDAADTEVRYSVEFIDVPREKKEFVF